MNKTYRLVWSHRLGALVAVSEITSGRGKNGCRAKTLATAIGSALLAMSGLPEPAHAVSSCSGGNIVISGAETDSCVLGNGDTLSVDSSGSISVSGVDHAITVNSGISSGSITNSGSITADANGINLGAGTINGNISNSGGNINSTNGSAIEVSSGTVVGNILNTVGSTISAAYSGIELYQASVTGNVINSGLIDLNANNTVGIGLLSGTTVDGDITNNGTINATQAGIYLTASTLAGNVINNGVINGNIHGVVIATGSSINGALTNSGTISVQQDRAIGVSGSFITQGITNTGTINIQDGSADEAAIYLRAGAVVSGGIYNLQTGTTGGVILAQGSASNLAGIYIESSTLNGGIVNTGTIFGESGSEAAYGIAVLNGGILNDGITNHGTIKALGTGSSPAAITISSATINGGITNTGLIYGGEFGAGSGGSTGYGIFIYSGTLNGGIVNSGTIFGANDGINVYNGTLSGGITNSGTIIGGHDGIYMTNGILGGGITNSGTIDGGHDGISLNYSSSTVSGDIVNSGIIHGVSRGIYFSEATLSGAINNSGRIIGDSGSGIYLSSGTITNGITNSGTISGANYAIYASGTATLPNLDITGTNSKLLGDVNAVNTDVTIKNGAIFGNTNAFDVKTFTVENGAVFNFNTGPHTASGLSTSGVKVANGFFNSGIVSVGTSTPTITGNYTQSTGGTFQFGFTNASTYGRLYVTGNATLASGSVVDVRLAGSPGVPGTRINGVIVAGSSLINSGVSVTDNSALYNFTASTDRNANELDLVTAVDQNSITSAVGPAEQGAAQELLRMLNTGIPPAMQPVFDQLGTMNSAQLSNAVSQMLPTLVGAFPQAAINPMHSLSKIIQSRIESNQGLSSGDKTADQFMWMRAFANRGNQDDLNGVSGFRSNSAGLVIGGDAPLTDRIRAGGALLYANTRINSNSDVAPSHVDVDTFGLIGYGSYNIGPATDINAQIGVTRNNGGSRRLISFMGTTAKADLDSLSWQGSLGIGHTFSFGNTTSVTPSLRTDYAQMRTKSYTERGAGPLNLHVDEDTYREFLLVGDVKFSHQLNDTMRLVGNGSIGYDFINKQAKAVSTFTGGGAAFVTRGMEVSPWIYRVGLGLVNDNRKGLEYSVRYEAEARTSGYLNQTVWARVRWEF